MKSQIKFAKWVFSSLKIVLKYQLRQLFNIRNASKPVTGRNASKPVTG